MTDCGCEAPEVKTAKERRILGIALALNAAMSSRISRVNTPGMAAAPMRTEGRSSLTMAPSSFMGACACAKGALCAEIPPSARSWTMRPRESLSQTFFRASSMGMPSLLLTAMARRLAMPRAASPAPWKRKVCSLSLVLVALRAASMPATATEAVPWNVRMGWINRTIEII